MKLARMVYVGMAIFGVAACSTVYVEEPIGTEIVQVEEDDWEGIWVGPDDEAVIVGVRDRDAGILWMAGIDERDGEPTMESRVVYVRSATHQGNRRLFVSMEDEDEERYAWALVVRDEEYLILYAPAADKFSALVREGTLPGRVASESEMGGRDLYLGRLEPEHLEAIFAEESGALFAWEEPFILRRVARVAR